MKHATSIIAAALLLAGATAACAGGAPWFKWKSRTTPDVVCAQVLSEEGWEKIEGPFKDASCRKPGNPA